MYTMSFFPGKSLSMLLLLLFFVVVVVVVIVVAAVVVAAVVVAAVVVDGEVGLMWMVVPGWLLLKMLTNL